MKVNANLPKDQRILLAAEEIFSVKGYEKATIDEIIVLADVGKGTLYKYFGNKEQLFYKLVSDKNAPFVENLKSIVENTEGLENKLIGYLETMIAFYRENRSLWQIICFEMLGISNGCRVVKEDDRYVVLSRYSNIEPSEKLKEQILRYHDLMVSEFYILYSLINEGMKCGFLKQPYARTSARELFWSVAMCIFNPLEDENDMSSHTAATIIVDRYLYGAKNKK